MAYTDVDPGDHRITRDMPPKARLVQTPGMKRGVHAWRFARRAEPGGNGLIMSRLIWRRHHQHHPARPAIRVDGVASLPGGRRSLCGRQIRHRHPASTNIIRRHPAGGKFICRGPLLNNAAVRGRIFVRGAALPNQVNLLLGCAGVVAEALIVRFGPLQRAARAGHMKIRDPGEYHLVTLFGIFRGSDMPLQPEGEHDDGVITDAVPPFGLASATAECRADHQLQAITAAGGREGRTPHAEAFRRWPG